MNLTYGTWLSAEHAVFGWIVREIKYKIVMRLKTNSVELQLYIHINTNVPLFFYI